MPTEPVIHAPGFVLPAIGTQTGFAWDEIVFSTTMYGTLVFPPGGAGTDIPAVPGVCGKVEVTCEGGREFGTHKTPGKDGHRIVDKGYVAAKGKITLTAWTQDGLDVIPFILDAFQAKLKPKDRTPIEVHHPTIAAHKVNKIVATLVSGPEPDSSLKGAFKTTISFMEWFPTPRKKNVTHTVVAAQIAPGRLDPTLGGTNRPNLPANAINFTPSQTNTNP